MIRDMGYKHSKVDPTAMNSDLEDQNPRYTSSQFPSSQLTAKGDLSPDETGGRSNDATPLSNDASPFVGNRGGSKNSARVTF